MVPNSSDLLMLADQFDRRGLAAADLGVHDIVTTSSRASAMARELADVVAATFEPRDPATPPPAAPAADETEAAPAVTEGE